MSPSAHIKHALHKPYMWSVIACGMIVLTVCALGLDVTRLDIRFTFISLVTIFGGSRIGISFSRHQIHITVSDTLVFLTLLIFGGEAAVLVAAAEAFVSSFRFSKLWVTRTFNASLLAISTFLAYRTVELFFGRAVSIVEGASESTFVSAIVVLALVQYFANSILASLREALKNDRRLVQTWTDNFVWTSITYFAGAAAAAITAKLIVGSGFYAFAASLPIIAIIYFTYQSYRKQLDARTAQAEQAARHAEEQKVIAEALRQSEEHFRSAFDNAAVAMALVATDGKWMSVNPALCTLLGYPESELLELSLQAVVHPDELGEALSDMYRISAGHAVTRANERRFVNQEGSVVWTAINMSSVADAAGRTTHFILQVQDVTERKTAEDRLHQAAFYDALTGLPNRARFTEQLDAAIAESRRSEDHLVAVLFLDLDRFKNINDSLGHAVGDQLLRAVAQRLTTAVRPSDTVSRFGGDEFAVLLDGAGGPDKVTEVTSRILRLVEKPYRLSGYEVVTSCSIGVTFSTLGYENTEDFLRDADTAMYRAKEKGKGRFEIFDKFMHARALSRLQLENDLRYAIERNEFDIYFQPIIELRSKRLSGFEALIRWNHPTRGLVSPADFIPVAEDTDLIVPIGDWILEEACRQVRLWQEAFVTDMPLSISVNLSSRQFKQQDLVERVKQILFRTGLPAETLRLEITESVVMDSAEDAISMLRQLRSVGVQLSIDDFGTGYSSLSYLHRFPVNILKIDRSFVSRMTVESESHGIVETIITLASKLKMDVVAEGVETREQLTVLENLNCDYAQGFLFSRPLDRAAAELELLQRSKQQYFSEPARREQVGEMVSSLSM